LLRFNDTGSGKIRIDISDGNEREKGGTQGSQYILMQMKVGVG